MLQPFEGVIAADSGHVNVHEAGAVEYTGHKVLSLAEKMARLQLPIWKIMWRGFMRTTVTNIWYFREWFIFLSRQSMERCIPKRNFRKSMRYARKEIFRYLLTERGLAMDLPAVKMM